MELYAQIEAMFIDALYSNRRMCSIVDWYGITLLEKRIVFHSRWGKI